MAIRRLRVVLVTLVAFGALIALAGAAPASAEPVMVDAKVLGQVEPLGSNSYREVGVAIRLSEPADFGATTLPAAAFSATLTSNSTNRLIGWVYTNSERITRPERTNVPGEWLILEFSSNFQPSPLSPAGLASRQYSISQGQTISGNGTTMSSGGAIVTTGVYSPVLEEFEPASIPVAGELPMLFRFFVPRVVRDNTGWVGAKYPLVLALHGSGERGDINANDNMRQMVANQLGVAWAMPDRQAENPAFVIVPQARTMGGAPSNPLSWGVPARKASLASLIEEFIAEYPVDPRRIYITGVSMGGMGAWDMYSSYPSLFAGAMPIASGIQEPRGMTTAMIPPLVNKPLWNLHAFSDNVVPIAGSDLAATTLSGLGVPVNQTTFAGNLSRADANSAAAAQLAAANLAGSKHLFTTYAAGTVTPSPHESWQPAFINDTVYNWLFSQTVDGGPVLAPPGAPDAPMAVEGDSHVSLTWQVPQSQGGAPVDSYVVRVYEDGNLINTIDVESGLGTTVEDLENGVTYTFTVQAVSAVGAGAESEAAVSTPVGLATAPQSLDAVVADRDVDLSWQVPASDGGLPITGYVMEIIENSSEKPSVEVDAVTSHRLSGLNYGSTYEIRIRAVNSAGEGAPSNTVIAVISDLKAPNTKITASPAKKALKLSKKKGKAKVKFKFNSTEAGSTFQCRINSGKLNKWKKCKSGVSYKLKPGKYTFRVRATDAAGNADPSPAKKKIKVTKKK